MTGVLIPQEDSSYVDLDAEIERVAGGGSTAGAAIVRGPFSFTFDTPGLTEGVPIGYTPAVGDVLIDAWFEVVEAWDGTTPLADIGPFDPFTYGVFGDYIAVNLMLSDTGSGSYDISTSENQGGSAPLSSSPSLASSVHVQGGRAIMRQAPASIFAAKPWLLVVSQDGTKGGADPGSAQGAARLYIVTATPAAFA